jgi:hypothetical protein
MDKDATGGPKSTSLPPTWPLLARIAGLPIDTIRAYRSDQCAEASNRYNRIHDSLTSMRAQLIDRLYKAIQNASPGQRRFLLSVKRACFNHRPLERYCNAVQWPMLVEFGGSLVDDILALESELAAVVDRFEQDYRRICIAQRGQLLRHIADPGFRRGLALASPAVSLNVNRLNDGVGNYAERRRRSLETTLVRYVSRAALKLSPFSTFTRVALAAVDVDASHGVKLIGEQPWIERSLLRIRRYLLDQYVAALMLYEPFRRGLFAVLNNSLVELPDSRWRFVRPGHWRLDPESGTPRYHWAALIEVQADGDLLPWLMDELNSAYSTYGRICDILRTEGELIGSVADVDELIDIGLVNLLTPWSMDDAWVERRLLEHLRTLPQAARLDLVIDCLRELVHLEESYASTGTADRSVERIAGLIDELWENLRSLTKANSGTSLSHPSNHDYYEDVVLESPGCGKAALPVVYVSHAAADACLRSIAPMLRLSTLFRHNEDFLYTMSAYVTSRCGARDRFGLLELFQAVQPIWQDFTNFCLSSSHVETAWPSTFNPMGLPVLRDIQDFRDHVRTGIDSCIIEHEDFCEISMEALEQLLFGTPSSYAPKAGACLFMQPTDPEGTSWVVNQFKEGTGRFASRFTAVMETATRRRYLDTLATRVSARASGAGELLDVGCIQGDTANVHPPHTSRVIEMPGDAVDLPRSRRLSLNDLHVRIDRDALIATMHDDAGRCVIPTYFGGAHAWYLPPLERFLCTFGPSELIPILPPPRSVQISDCLLSKRMVIGNLVLRRRAWSFPVSKLQRLTAGLSEAHSLLAINRWRTLAGIPEQVFIVGDVSSKSRTRARKPQYIDFSSPLFLRVFASVLQYPSTNEITLEEVLPIISMMPHDSSNVEWAVEVLLDSIMFP